MEILEWETCFAKKMNNPPPHPPLSTKFPINCEEPPTMVFVPVDAAVTAVAGPAVTLELPTDEVVKLVTPDQLEVVKSEEYPNSVFFKKDGVVVMEQNKKNKDFYFDYDKIWGFFESFFGMEYEQIREVLRYWLEETFKLEGYTPVLHWLNWFL